MEAKRLLDVKMASKVLANRGIDIVFLRKRIASQCAERSNWGYYGSLSVAV